MLMIMRACNRDEEVADLEAFQRQYEDDQSWTALQEDEYGRLRPLVSTSIHGWRGLPDLRVYVAPLASQDWQSHHDNSPSQHLSMNSSLCMTAGL